MCRCPVQHETCCVDTINPPVLPGFFIPKHVKGRKIHCMRDAPVVLIVGHRMAEHLRPEQSATHYGSMTLINPLLYPYNRNPNTSKAKSLNEIDNLRDMSIYVREHSELLKFYIQLWEWPAMIGRDA